MDCDVIGGRKCTANTNILTHWHKHQYNNILHSGLARRHPVDMEDCLSSAKPLERRVGQAVEGRRKGRRGWGCF